MLSTRHAYQDVTQLNRSVQLLELLYIYGDGITQSLGAICFPKLVHFFTAELYQSLFSLKDDNKEQPRSTLSRM